MSFLALVLAMGGGAYAATKINGKDIRKGTIPASALSSAAKRTLRGPTGPAGPQGIQGPQGNQGPAGQSATRLWAVVSDTGQLVRNTGVSSVAKVSGVAGQYEVTFTQDISGCAAVASIGQTGNGPALAGLISTVHQSANKIGVFTANPNNNPTNYPFHLAVFCA